MRYIYLKDLNNPKRTLTICYDVKGINTICYDVKGINTICYGYTINCKNDSFRKKIGRIIAHGRMLTHPQTFNYNSNPCADIPNNLRILNDMTKLNKSNSIGRIIKNYIELYQNYNETDIYNICKMCTYMNFVLAKRTKNLFNLQSI